MRIGIDARPLSGPIDGISRYTEEIVTRLITNQTHEWFLYSHSSLRTEISAPNVTLRTPKETGALGRALRTLRLGNLARKDLVEVFWTPRHHLPIGSLPAHTVATIHDLCWLVEPGTMPVQRRLREAALFSRSIASANRIATVSEATARDLIAHYPQTQPKIQVTYPGSVIPPSKQASEKLPVILAVGTVEPRKNYQLLLDTFAAICNQVPHDLIIVGRHGWGDKRTISERIPTEARHRVRWIENADDEHLEKLYRQASLFISLASYEGFGLPLLEAMTAGTAVFASDIAAHREVTGDVARLHTLDDVKGLRAALTVLLLDPAEQRRMAAAGLARSGAFSWDRTSEQTLALLEGC